MQLPLFPTLRPRPEASSTDSPCATIASVASGPLRSIPRENAVAVLPQLTLPMDGEDSPVLQASYATATLSPLPQGQRRKDLRSMRRRSGQKGVVVRKGKQWHVRYLQDVQNGRKKRSVHIGPAVGKGRLTRAEAQRKAAELIEQLGINSETH